MGGRGEGELRNQIGVGEGTNSNLTRVAGRKRSRGEAVRTDKGGENTRISSKERHNSQIARASQNGTFN